MNVLVLKRDLKKVSDEVFYEDGQDHDLDKLPDQTFGSESLHIMLPLCDHVIVALPLTGETLGMIGEREFKIMKRETILVNVGRGPIVEEKALISALNEGWISGAGLDVFDIEPLPPDNPLWQMENAIITPHSGVGGDPADKIVIDIFINNLGRFQRGETLINIVDKKAGY